MALLEIENVRRSFGGLIAVGGVSCQVLAGQIKAVIGPNGAGKTTLFNLISGLLKPDGGRVLFRGEPIDGLRPFEIAGRGVARTFQNPSLFLQMSVLENVMVGRHPRARWGFLGCSVRWPAQQREEHSIREAAQAHLDHVGLGHLAATQAGALAFGQRRLVELARALATEPALLLLDEPASGLNTREKKDLAGLLRTLPARGITLLLVEHDMNLVMELADSILVLHNGVALAEGSPRVVSDDPNVIRVYLGAEINDVAAG